MNGIDLSFLKADADERKNLLDEMSRQFTTDELRVLVKVARDPDLRKMAFREARKRIK